MGRLTLHDLHEQNLEAMQCVVDLGRQLGRPIRTSLWSSRADKPPNGGSSGENDIVGVLFSPSRAAVDGPPANMFSRPRLPAYQNIQEGLNSCTTHVRSRCVLSVLTHFPGFRVLSVWCLLFARLSVLNNRVTIHSFPFFSMNEPSGPASRGSPSIGDNRRPFVSRPGSLVDVGSAIGGDSGGLGSTLGLGLGSTFGSTMGSTFGGGGGGSRMGAGNSAPPSAGPRDAAHASSRSSRHQRHDNHHHQHQRQAAGSGILSEFALSALSGNGNGGGSSELSVAVGARGGGAAGGGPAAGGRAATASASAQQALQYVGGPQPLSPAARGAAPPGSVLSSFASPGSASLRWV